MVSFFQRTLDGVRPWSVNNNVVSTLCETTGVVCCRRRRSVAGGRTTFLCDVSCQRINPNGEIVNRSSRHGHHDRLLMQLGAQTVWCAGEREREKRTVVLSHLYLVAVVVGEKTRT